MSNPGIFRRRGTASAITSLFAASILALGAGGAARAAGPLTAASPSPSPTSGVTQLTLKGICGDTLAKAKAGGTIIGTTSDPNGVIATQKLELCKAAEQSQNAVNANNILWKIWAGVAGVCVVDCMMPLPTGFICTGASAGAAVTDAIKTKQFASALTGLAGVGTSLMLKPKAEAGKPKGKNLGACVAAATAGMQAITKKMSIGSQKKALEETLQAAAELDSQAQAINNGNGNGGGGGGTRNGLTPGSDGTQLIAGQNSTGSGASSTILSTGNSGTSMVSTACKDANSGGGVTSIVQCAVKSDPTLPKFVSDPNFDKNFSKYNNGEGIAPFVAKTPNGSNPGSAIQQLADQNGLTPEQSTGLGQALAATDKQLQDDVPGTAYSAGGGGGGHGHGGDSAADDAAAIAAAMSAMMGGGAGKGQDGAHNGISEANFARDPAQAEAAAEEGGKGWTIFDRVTYRYQRVGPRLLPEGASLESARRK